MEGIHRRRWPRYGARIGPNGIKMAYQNISCRSLLACVNSRQRPLILVLPLHSADPGLFCRGQWMKLMRSRLKVRCWLRERRTTICPETRVYCARRLVRGALKQKLKGYCSQRPEAYYRLVGRCGVTQNHCYALYCCRDC
jgi:hypothetical protein